MKLVVGGRGTCVTILTKVMIFLLAVTETRNLKKLHDSQNVSWVFSQKGDWTPPWRCSHVEVVTCKGEWGH